MRKREQIFHVEDNTLCLIEDLKALRKQKGLTQREMAKRMGFTFQRFQQLESGQRCSVDLLVRWARALDRQLELTR